MKNVSIVISSPFKGFPVWTSGCFMIPYYHERNGKQYCRAVCTRCLLVLFKNMLDFAAAHASNNHARNKTWSPGAVSLFLDRLYANFSSTKITSLTRTCTKAQKTSCEKNWLYGSDQGQCCCSWKDELKINLSGDSCKCIYKMCLI